MLTAPNLDFPWLIHGFGQRDGVLSIPIDELTTAKQIHSAHVLNAAQRKGEQIGEGDAILSADAGIAVAIRTADCVPVLLADPVTRVVACVHAGWRGSAANIVGATVDAMRSRGCRPESLRVAIGPSIGSCCYEVGAEVADCFSAWRRNMDTRTSGVGKRLTLDLPAINESQLLESGVRQIWKSGECTYCHAEKYYSYRREKEQAGRMISFVSRLA